MNSAPTTTVAPVRAERTDAVPARPRWSLPLAWVSLVLQIVIVGTGGAVRLTESGLGCPTWPLCTTDSLIATPEMGIHGAVEFGNRTVALIVLLAAAAVILSLRKVRSTRRDVVVPAVLVLAGTVLQAVIGGISVWIKLHPMLVGIHYLISAVLVALAAVVVYGLAVGPSGERAVPGWLAGLTHATSALVAVAVIAGILTTGSGPHAGDSLADRNGLDPLVMQHVHSWPAYAAFLATIALATAAWRVGAPRLRVLATALLAVELVQIAVGIWQSREGLPVLLVGVHMVLAVILVAVMTAAVLSLKAPRRA